LLGGLPVTSVIVRTSANIQAGAKTKMSSIIQGVLLLISVAFIPRFLNLIPLPSIAAVLIYIGYKLAKLSIFKEYYRKGWDQFMPFIVTVIAILLTDILIGLIDWLCIGLIFPVKK
jgi:MFS superfamily sulfate permease-like transporter